jgi:hypothetical protein
MALTSKKNYSVQNITYDYFNEKRGNPLNTTRQQQKKTKQQQQANVEWWRKPVADEWRYRRRWL